MRSSQKTALLWVLAAVAFILAGLIDEPRRPLAIGTGLLLLVVGIVSTMRGRRIDPMSGLPSEQEGRSPTQR